MGAGQRPVFSDEENEALREACKGYRKKLDLSQTELGALIGIEQQNVGRFEKGPRAGLSRAAANKLARLLGYRDAEDFLLDRGVLAAMKETPGGSDWHARDVAVRVAKRMGLDPAAVDAVVARFASPDYRAKPMKWWNSQFVWEEAGRAAEAPETPIVRPAQIAKGKTKKRSGTHG